MKRLLILVLCMGLTLSLFGCASTPAPTDPPLFPTEATVPQITPTEKPTEPESDALLLVDNADCAFTVTGYEDNAHLGLQIQVLCENKSDRPLMFSWNNVSVCGFMYEPMWAEEVAPGKKVHSTVGIDTYLLEQLHVDSVDQVVFTLTVRDSEEFMNQPVVDSGFCIYPTGKTPDQVISPQYRHTEGETVITENDTLTFIITEVDDELSELYTLRCYLQNNTGKNLIVSWEDVSVNGFMVNPFWSVAVGAGMQAYSDILFYRSDLDRQDIEVVQNIEFRLQAMDYDDWNSDYLFDEVFTFKP